MIVRDGQVLARGRNLGRTNGDPTAHGEMIAIRRCLADHGTAALQGSTLYTSGEPCVMCMGAILWCRIGRLVFAASVQQIAAKMDEIMISSADVAAKARFVPITITGGVLADEALRLFAKPVERLSPAKSRRGGSDPSSKVLSAVPQWVSWQGGRADRLLSV